MKKIILNLINYYRHRPHDSHSTCRFQPTCSLYSYQAIDKYGILKGGLLSLKRIFKCNPLSKGGLDLLV